MHKLAGTSLRVHLMSPAHKKNSCWTGTVGKAHHTRKGHTHTHTQRVRERERERERERTKRDDQFEKRRSLLGRVCVRRNNARGFGIVFVEVVQDEASIGGSQVDENAIVHTIVGTAQNLPVVLRGFKVQHSQPLNVVMEVLHLINGSQVSRWSGWYAVCGTDGTRGTHLPHPASQSPSVLRSNLPASQSSEGEQRKRDEKRGKWKDLGLF